MCMRSCRGHAFMHVSVCSAAMELVHLAAALHYPSMAQAGVRVHAVHTGGYVHMHAARVRNPLTMHTYVCVCIDCRALARPAALSGTGTAWQGASAAHSVSHTWTAGARSHALTHVCTHAPDIVLH